MNDAKKFACHAGVVPFEHQSGKYKGRSKTSNKANKQLKALLHNRAASAIQHYKEIKEYYVRKTAQGKNEMLVRNNICNNGTVHAADSSGFLACTSKSDRRSGKNIKIFIDH